MLKMTSAFLFERNSGKDENLSHEAHKIPIITPEIL
jgi:hypothetical protein